MTGVAEHQKIALLDELADARREFVEQASRMDPPLRKVIFPDGWTVLDMLAQMAGWDDANRQAIDAIRSGKLPDFYEYAERGWVTLNSRFARDYKRGSLEELVEQARHTRQALVDALEAVPPEDLHRDFKVRFRRTRITIDRLLRAQVVDERRLTADVGRYLSVLAHGKGRK